MWVVHLTLGLAALYAAIIAGIYFAQTWLLFSDQARWSGTASASRFNAASQDQDS